MLDELLFIINFVVDAFWHVWPYLLITIPLAVAVQMSGAAKHINRAFSGKPTTAIVMATVVGAFSPFCSCGVIPVVAALLIGGVPLAPVMAFWVASPSMDPEIFFLSAAMIGWELAIWRVVATLILSMAAGFITQALMQRGWLGTEILRTQTIPENYSQWELIQQGWQRIRQRLQPTAPPVKAFATNTITLTESWQQTAAASATDSCCNSKPSQPESSCGCAETTESQACCTPQAVTFQQRLFDETWAATLMVIKFMLLAFVLEALITRYVPQSWIISLLGEQNWLAIPTAALVGVPIYTTNLTALPLIGGLLTQGMSPGAALAFLVAGPTTTLPAMAAVWGLTTRRIFGLYVAFSLVGAVLLGYIYTFVIRFGG